MADTISMINVKAYKRLLDQLASKKAQLVAVSKTKSADDIRKLYDLGQRDFGENYVQELTQKSHDLPKDIRWHFIGHLQTNKVKQLAPFIHLIQSVDTIKLLSAIDSQAKLNNRRIDCLLQVHIAEEQTKFGFSETDIISLLSNEQGNSGNKILATMEGVRVFGLMGMASLTGEEEKIKMEFRKLRSLCDYCRQFRTPNFNIEILSMGMSGDYQIALQEGSNLVRIGSLIFGEREAKSKDQ